MLTPQDEQLRRGLAQKSFMAAAAEVRSISMHAGSPVQGNGLTTWSLRGLCVALEHFMPHKIVVRGTASLSLSNGFPLFCWSLDYKVACPRALPRGHKTSTFLTSFNKVTGIAAT